MWETLGTIGFVVVGCVISYWFERAVWGEGRYADGAKCPVGKHNWRAARYGNDTLMYDEHGKVMYVCAHCEISHPKNGKPRKVVHLGSD